MAPMAPADTPTTDSAPFDAAWLSSRRWFRSKARPLREVAVHDAATLGGDAWLLVLAARFADGGEARYFVPAVADHGTFREPPDGAGAWRAIVTRMAAGAGSIEGQSGSFGIEPTAALADLLPDGEGDAARLEEHRLQVEQSNTSVRLGNRLMLKLYRLLEPGINPEVEVTAFLTEVGFRHAPTSAGWISYLANDAEPAAAAVVQSLVPSRGDAWSWMMDRLPVEPQGPVQALAGAAEIGGITAELHAALRSDPRRSGFPARPATPGERGRWRAGAEEQLEAALAAAHGEERKRLERHATGIRERFEAMTAATDAWTSRIHGDYHLGQLLATDDGFVVIDFEGEPARPLAERRQPSSPLRDVAGMLRSLDYAARSAERHAPSFQPDRWLGDARTAFLGAYGGAGESALLTAFELEKACYEVHYEANYRPGWVWLPIGAIERLMA